MNDSNVEFNEGGGNFNNSFKPVTKVSTMAKLLLKTGVIKDADKAPIVYIVVIIICLALSAFFFSTALS